MRDRRREPRRDVVSQLVAAEVDGVRLEDEAIYSFLRLLLPAGVETTARSLVSLVRRLLAHPDQLDAVRRERTLVPQAVEEGLRYDAPSDLVVRLESGVVLNALLDRLPGLRTDPDRPPPRATIGSNRMSVLDSLPVLFDV